MRLTAQQRQSIIDYHYQPLADDGLLQAAVSMVLRDGKHGTEVLLMQRAYHKNDPWSGQMAFPGGKIEASDYNAKAAAERETLEEVGIKLRADEYLARLDDVYGLGASQNKNVHVASFAFWLNHPVKLKGNYEVGDLVWLPFSHLMDMQYRHQVTHPLDQQQRWPAVMINQDKQQILWGLSLRMLARLAEIIGLENHQQFNQLAIADR